MVDLYEKLDEGIMYGVNKVVQAWNWTTGKTKEDLANPILAVGGILGVQAYLDLDRIISATLLAGATIGIMQINSKLGSCEREYSDQGLKCHCGERQKDINSTMAPAILVISGLGELATSQTENSGIYSNIHKGFALAAASMYVMRADSLPPRKSVFVRAKDKIAEAARNIEMPVPEGGTAMVPIPIPLEQRLNFI
jgi:hypothetical protein